MFIYELDGLVPVISEKAFVHETAVIIGDVFINEGVYVGPHASLRGDFGRIIIGKNANIQDSCILHSTADIDMIVEENGHIGHSAVLHCCHIKYNAMVGMAAVVLDGAIIGENSIIGAQSLVTGGIKIPDNHLALGVPAKIKRELSKQEIEWKIENTVAYIKLAARCLNNYKPCRPLAISNLKRDKKRFEVIYKQKPKAN